MSIINPNAVVRRPFKEGAQTQAAYLSEGKFARFETDGSISIAASATDLPHGLISNPDGASAAAAGGIPYADVILPNFGGIVQVQVGASPGTINPGTLLKIKADGTVMSSSSAANDVVVAMALEPISAATEGQLINAVLIPPYKVAAS